MKGTAKMRLLTLVCTAVALIFGVIFAFAPRPTFAEDGGASERSVGEITLIDAGIYAGEGPFLSSDGEITQGDAGVDDESKREGKDNYLVVLTVVFSVLLAVNTGLIISQLMIRMMGDTKK